MVSNKGILLQLTNEVRINTLGIAVNNAVQYATFRMEKTEMHTLPTVFSAIVAEGHYCFNWGDWGGVEGGGGGGEEGIISELATVFPICTTR